jgi:hypothetical protein
VSISCTKSEYPFSPSLIESPIIITFGAVLDIGVGGFGTANATVEKANAKEESSSFAP